MSRLIEITKHCPLPTGDTTHGENTIMSIPHLGVNWNISPDTAQDIQVGAVKLSTEAWKLTQALVTARRNSIIDNGVLEEGIEALAGAVVSVQRDKGRSGIKIGMFHPCDEYLKRMPVDPKALHQQSRQLSQTVVIEEAKEVEESGKLVQKNKTQTENSENRPNSIKQALRGFPKEARRTMLELLKTYTNRFWRTSNSEGVKKEQLNWIKTHGSLFAPKQQ